MKRLKYTQTILIIEDEDDIRNFASRVLELEGYRVVTAGTGEEGFRLAQAESPHLVLLDLKLPGLSGWGVLKRLKKKPRFANLPVIMFTASAAIPQREKAQKLGAVAYLTKPLSAAKLRETVSQVLVEVKGATR